MKYVAVKLGNTPAICRRCYIHPAVVECYLGRAFHRSLDALPMGRAVHPIGLSASRLTIAFLRKAHWPIRTGPDRFEQTLGSRGKACR